MVGINDKISDHANFKLYPNPNNGRFIIEFDDKTINKINLEIYSLLGEKIFEKSDLNPQSSNEIDLSDSPKGVYMVRILDGEKIYSEKIVIQ